MRKKVGSQEDKSPSRQVDATIEAVGNRRGEMLSRLRALIKQADPEVVEDVKWRKPSNPDGVPVWSHDGIICIGEALKNRVRLTFAEGASLKDPKGLFNTRLDSKSVRAIDIAEGEWINEGALKDLVRGAVALNTAASRER